MHPLTVYALGLVAIFFVVHRAYRKERGRPRPTGFVGPRQYPWVGRIHDLPIQYMWLKLKEWADTYGPVYYTEMLGTDVLVVSDEALAEELLVRRANINSDRPQIRSLFDAKSTHGSMEYLPLMGRNGKRDPTSWCAPLTSATNQRYWGVMEFEVKRWLNLLLEQPDNFAFSLEDMASKIMCTLTWDDHELSAYCTQSAWGLLTQMSPAGPITNVLTPLWHIPYYLNPWKLAERKRHDEQNRWWMERLQNTRRAMAAGTQRPCFTRTFLETEKTDISGDHEASCVIGMMALVGIFTVAGPLYYFLVSMVHHPEWQAKCQEELDRVCGGRMPTLADMDRLPILRACIKETMRWKPNVPTGVAHECEEDQDFGGRFIPKGTRILPLDYAFLRNPKKYPFPEEFRPERWLENTWPTYQEPLTKFPTVKGLTSFGWGRRQCLGMSLTQDELVAACGGLLWAFNLKHKRTPQGDMIPVPLNKSNSLLIVKPDPFEMVFEPRSDTRTKEVVEQWRAASKEDEEKRAAFLREQEGMFAN